MSLTTEEKNFLLLPDLVKSANDKRKYRAIELKNGLRALLVSDSEPLTDQNNDTADEPQEKMAAAALCVDVGYYSDPFELPGLAHYLEHMLFMGSEKYPDENAFDGFIKSNGGDDNAFTDCERTLYLFQITTKHFRSALDIFSQFFIAPLMKAESMEREVKSVDSEFQLNVPKDDVRSMLLFNTLAKEGNPQTKFGIGNADTLKNTPESQGINVYDRMREFYNMHYSSHLMTLCVLSRESLDTLQDWVIDLFESVPKKDISSPNFEGHEQPFRTPNFYQLYRMSAIKKTHQISVSWSLPCLTKHYKVKPLRYIAWLGSHEGEGGILDYLRKRNWATSVQAGLENTRLTSLFSLNVTMSDTGIDHIEDILLVIFQYLDMLRKKGPQKNLYDELQNLSATDFRWKDEVDAVDYVQTLSKGMQLYQLEDLITAEEILTEYNENLISDCLETLQPDNCNIMIVSSRYQKDDPCDKTEKWMQTPYSQEDIPSEWIDTWKDPPSNEELHLPEANAFISTDFDIKVTENQYDTDIPAVLKKTALTTLWYKKDLKFNVPKGCIVVLMKSPLLVCSPQSAALLDLFLYQLRQNLTSEAYYATMASLDYSVSHRSDGLTLTLTGFNHKLPVLLEKVLDGIVNFDLNEDKFEGLKSHFSKSYYNGVLNPQTLGAVLFKTVTKFHAWTNLEKRLMLEKLTLQSLKAFHQQLIGNLSVKVMVHGNFAPEEAMEIGDLIEMKIKFNRLSPEMIPQRRTIQLPLGERTLRIMSFNKDDVNSCVYNYYQFGPGSIYLSSMVDLLLDLMSEPCFDILRTKEQLGYSVGCEANDTYGILGFLVYVNSPADKFSCSHLDNRIENFLEVFREQIESLNYEDFQGRVSSLVKTKNTADSNMYEEATRNWTEIASSNLVFDRTKRETEYLQKLNLNEFKEWARSVLDKSSYRKLSVQVVGTGDIAQSECVSYREAGESDSTEIPDVYHLHYLLSNQNQGNDIFIVEIASFKNNLYVYPVTKLSQ